MAPASVFALAAGAGSVVLVLEPHPINDVLTSAPHNNILNNRFRIIPSPFKQLSSIGIKLKYKIRYTCILLKLNRKDVFKI